MQRNYSIICAIVLSSFLLQAEMAEKKVIFLWDLHGVVLKKDAPLKTAFNYRHTFKALTHEKSRGKVLKLFLKGMFEEFSSEKFIHIAEKYNNPHLKELIIKTSNAQKPILETVSIIKELKEKGYTHHVGSNIGSSAFQALIDPLQFPQMQDIFKHFDIAASHVVTHLGNRIVKKPDPDFFKVYIAKNKIDFSTTQIIFIDDKKENIEVAERLGFIAIPFKDPAQLRIDLHKLGIDITV